MNYDTLHCMAGYKPIHIWGLDLIDGKTLHQFLGCMEPYWVKQGALMPDAHYGYTMPIGGVIETDCHVVPAWVGYDIGCGVGAVVTDFNVNDILANGAEIQEALKASIPNGVGVYHDISIAGMGQHNSGKTSEWFQDLYSTQHGDRQLGTLGAGNHYIEVCHDDYGQVIFVVHSGSRGIGHKTAEHYMQLARGVDDRENNWAFHVTSMYGEQYLADHDFLLEFAQLNRRVIMEQMVDVINSMDIPGQIRPGTVINNTHNHCLSAGAGRYVHRKGATIASEDDLSVVAGNSKDGSFVVRGRGNPRSMNSCSHGAGRKMGRNQARRELSLDDFHTDMEDVHGEVTHERIDEAPRAYKSPAAVMLAQSDLCKTVSQLRPILNVKGGSKRHG